MIRAAPLIVAWCATTAGCRMGPDYQRPPVDVDGAFRGAHAGTGSLGDLRWFEVFEDPELQVLIGTALAQNLDLRIAAARVARFEAAVGSARADQLPSASATASVSRERFGSAGFGVPIGPPGTEIEPTSRTLWQVEGSASWRLDFWGRYRRATEAARADLLAERWNRHAVITSLIADVAASYFQLQELDVELDIARQTLAARRHSLALVKMREARGAGSMLDVRQAEQLVATAAQTTAELELRIEQTENLLRSLLGANPGPIRRGRGLPRRADLVPAGLPSALLERRPDIRAAEARLIAANARIGVARAAYFPDIALTARGGLQSTALSELLTPGAVVWALASSLTQSIFEGGRLRAQERARKAERDEALHSYRAAIVEAFRDVSDALIALRKNRESRVAQERLVEAAREAARLALERYRAGADSYLLVLDAETRTFNAELGLARARLDEILALVRLYEALGGGWHAGR